MSPSARENADRLVKIHLIGIGGTGMGAVAGLLAGSGHEVRGSDAAVYPPMSEQLAALGVPVMMPYKAENAVVPRKRLTRP